MDTQEGSSKIKSLVYMTLVRPFLEHVAARWHPYREGQIRTLHKVQRKDAKFVHHINKRTWETLASRRKIVCVGALYKAYCGERTWKGVGNRLERPHYLSRADNNRKIRCRRQRTDRGKYWFVKRTIEDWNQLHAEVLEHLPCSSTAFRKRLRNVISEVR